ncbi:MAG TPA: C4-type zinc ribbon domain-containing protein [Vicinamibacterales bacterium]|nr:C4-type zinc ribbon domain-containing protein [Vicinamibacterales bacterium]
MLPDLERLIQLQELELRADAARRVVATAPERLAALDARLASARANLEHATAVIADNQGARRTVDKDLAAAQQRLEKYKEQSMAVKTNTEFHAMQHQMAAVKAEIDQFESRTLEVMMHADELAAALKAAEARLKADEAAVVAERKSIEAERARNEALVQTCATERAALVRQIRPEVVSTFEKVARARGGVALARAEKERCVVCQVRLRPMVFQAVVRNDEIVQCDSCQRILYFVPPRAGEAASQAEPAQPPTAPS